MAVQERNRANFADEGFNGAGELKFGLIEVVYEWAKGMVSPEPVLSSIGLSRLTERPLVSQSFQQITQLTDVQEGTIVRCMTRLDEACREVRDAARVMGNADLYTKMASASELIRRDVIFIGSLYL